MEHLTLKIKDLDQYRTDFGFYNITHIADNIYKQPGGGPYRVFTNEFFLFLELLPPGKHDLHLSVSVANTINTQYNYAADWTYHLIVKWIITIKRCHSSIIQYEQASWEMKHENHYRKQSAILLMYTSMINSIITIKMW